MGSVSSSAIPLTNNANKKKLLNNRFFVLFFYSKKINILGVTYAIACAGRSPHGSSCTCRRGRRRRRAAGAQRWRRSGHAPPARSRAPAPRRRRCPCPSPRRSGAPTPAPVRPTGPASAFGNKISSQAAHHRLVVVDRFLVFSFTMKKRTSSGLRRGPLQTTDTWRCFHQLVEN